MDLPPLRPRFRVVRVRQRRRPRAVPLREIFARTVEAAVKPLVVIFWLLSVSALVFIFLWALFMAVFGKGVN